MDVTNGIKCCNLSHFYIGMDQTYSMNLLVEVLLSRRLASTFRAANTAWEDFYSCSRLSIYLERSEIVQFRAEEEMVLSQRPEWIREAAGKAEVKELDKEFEEVGW